MTHGSLFSGIGGFDLGFERAGIRTVWQVEIDEYARKVLAKNFPHAERFRDIKDCGRHNLQSVDLISGGFPCQDISNAGRRTGIEGERSGLWTEMRRIICELRPRFVVVENVSALLGRGIERVLGDLAESGYDAEWDCIPAAAVGAPHQRDRVFIVAYAQCNGHGSTYTRPDPNSAERSLGQEYEHRETVRDGEDVAYATLRGQPVRGSAPGSGRHVAQCGEDVADTGRTGPPRRRTRMRNSPSREMGHVGITDGGEDMADADAVGCHGRPHHEGKGPAERNWPAHGSEDVADTTSERCGGRAEKTGWQAGLLTARSRRREDLADADGSRPAYGGESDAGRERGERRDAACTCGAREIPDSRSAGLSQSEREALFGARWREEGRAIAERDWWAVEPDVGRVAHGVPSRVDRLKGLGNAVVPQIAEWIGNQILAIDA